MNNLGFTSVSKVYMKDSYEFIKSLASSGEKFDIIFVDPPYLNHMVDRAVKLIAEFDLLNADGVIVTKYDKEEPIFRPEEKYELVDERKYGNTIIAFYQCRE